MRRVIGKRTEQLDADGFAALRSEYPDGLLLDVGTGDGKHVLTEARRRPSTLVVGVDAAPDAMRPTSASAARKAARGGVPNALFVWSSVEALPDLLVDVTEVHSLMPWGSLLRALVTPDVDVLHGLGALCRPGAGFLVTLNLHAWRPPVVDVGATTEPTPGSALTDLAPAYARAGWELTAADHLDAEQLAGFGTSWTKRLGSTREELAVLALRGTIG